MIHHCLAISSCPEKSLSGAMSGAPISPATSATPTSPKRQRGYLLLGCRGLTLLASVLCFWPRIAPGRLALPHAR